MENRLFTVVIEKDEDGWFVADVPELQGCHTQAKSMDEPIKRIKEVITLCVEEQKDEIERKEFVGIQMA